MDRKTWVTNFWARVEQLSPSECWLWLGGRVGHYGVLKTLYGAKITAHTASWMLKHQARVPESARIIQTCNNRLCCNPAHLETVKTNGLAPTAVTGERNGNSKLTDDQVAELRAHYERQGVTQSRLAKVYGISQGQVSRIVRRCNR